MDRDHKDLHDTECAIEEKMMESSNSVTIWFRFGTANDARRSGKRLAKTASLLAVLLVGACWGTAISAQNGSLSEMQIILHAPHADCAQLAPPTLTIDRPQTKTTGQLTVSSSTFGPEGTIPLINTSYGKSISPAVSWSPGPSGTKSYLLIMEDASAGRYGMPIMHWLAFNIPPQITNLPEGLPDPPVGLLEGGDRRAYGGPSAPRVAPPFHYALQVFALDTILNLAEGASRDAAWEAMNGHVLAKGDTIGTFQAPVTSEIQPDMMNIIHAPPVDCAQLAPPILTIDRPQTKTTGKLTVSSATFGPDGQFPLANSGYGKSISPAVSWSFGPSGTKSYVLMLENASAGQYRKAELHWLVFNIPSNVTNLDEGSPNPPAGMVLGSSSVELSSIEAPLHPGPPKGEAPGGHPGGGLHGDAMVQEAKGDPVYVAPHTPGGVSFRFALEVFALDTALDLPSGATRKEVWEAMNGHVLAKGDVAGTFQGPADKTQSPPSQTQ
jgi:Raf kinase inhibitor-like YbhB/YbcL family protein